MDQRSRNKDQVIQQQVDAWNGVWETTWNAEEVAEKCNKINVENISPIFDSSVSADEPLSVRNRSCAYIRKYRAI